MLQDSSILHKTWHAFRRQWWWLGRGSLSVHFKWELRCDNLGLLLFLAVWGCTSTGEKAIILRARGRLVLRSYMASQEGLGCWNMGTFLVFLFCVAVLFKNPQSSVKFVKLSRLMLAVLWRIKRRACVHEKSAAAAADKKDALRLVVRQQGHIFDFRILKVTRHKNRWGRGKWCRILVKTAICSPIILFPSSVKITFVFEGEHTLTWNTHYIFRSTSQLGVALWWSPIQWDANGGC